MQLTACGIRLRRLASVLQHELANRSIHQWVGKRSEEVEERQGQLYIEFSYGIAA